MIHLPVSIGEAIDKLTILDIKCRRIREEARVLHCKREYDMLYTQLQPHVDAMPFLYQQLYDVNDAIWIMQDDIRARPDPQKCVDILDKNDMRFRIKDTINRLAKSEIREQKGYPTRRALIIHHFGLGDHIGMIGAVRYIAFQYDETHVLCKPSNFANVCALFADNPSIKIFDESTFGPFDHNDYAHVFRSGHFSRHSYPQNDLPRCFYRDMELDPAIRHTHFFVPKTLAAKQMYEQLAGIPYRFVQQTSSSHTTSLVAWNIDEILTIDPNTNLYSKEHPWYSLAEACVNKPFLDYTEVIEHAQEIHTVESSFYCIACYIPLDATVKRCYSRETGAFIPKYNFN